MTEKWPEIPFGPWQDSCRHLQLISQIVGKYRLSHTPWLNHSWHATLYVTARGLTTSIVPDGPGGIEVEIDLIEHRVIARSTAGSIAATPLKPGSIADFRIRFTDIIEQVGGTPKFSDTPNEIPDAVRFSVDTAERRYDAEAVNAFFRACVQIDRVFKQFRTGFIGKVSPVHLFWGSFDVAVTRFSGNRAPRHPGGVPALPDDVTAEAYSHQVSSAGFWPGGGGIDYPAFYSYAYPGPDGFAEAIVEPAEARFDQTLGEFILPYDAVRTAPDPDKALLAFLQTSYDAAAILGQWDRANLECAPGRPLEARSVET